MKKLVLLVLSIYALSGVYAQQSIINDIDSAVLGKYIRLAMQNYPLKKASDATVERARAQKAITTLDLFDMFTAGYYYSPSKSDALVVVPGGTPGSSNIVTRGFQLGVNVNLGRLLSRPAMIKGAKAEYIIAQEQSKAYNNTLVNNVKDRYYAFLSAKRMLEIRTLAITDLRAIFSNAQNRFKNNEVSIDVYTSTKNSLVEAEAAALSAEVDYLKTKNELEDIIGTRLENVR